MTRDDIERQRVLGDPLSHVDAVATELVNTAEHIERLRLEISERHQEILRLQASCPHDYRPSNPAWLSSSMPECRLCGRRGDGWWCEASPTKECDYSRPNGRGYNPDDCRYCHQPEERK